ncbi:uncharacterized protein BN604_01363 [Bacteroides intestinalis CAG:315]|jgi:predicted secreted protein|uniref:Fibronectin type-III domain-containing protein n=1 Tax=Bacteroides intestinalis TaxID=329854 RepID=A0A412Y9M6_9BACE|nr:hypothetical protein [Bacteroides intestinalis]RGV54093.1 hypothetical protein DWW10_11340 [Bacteroides intestinalis]RHA59659.1 hypothetical protein DW932_11735 [Bacteroides intestinalis]CDD92890.1 uncharacterized protein BN604_01363 [Bacteroides intestinalis CAG:315]
MKLNKWLSILVVNCSLLIGFTACDDDDNDSNELSLSAPILTEIAAPTAIATSDVIVSQQDLDEGTIRVMAYGFCYNTSKNPTIYSATVKTLPENGKMEATLTDLTDNTVYYVRAFATLYPNGVVYSPEVEVTIGTIAPEPEPETPAE